MFRDCSVTSSKVSRKINRVPDIRGGNSELVQGPTNLELCHVAAGIFMADVICRAEGAIIYLQLANFCE
jgi:hypothetical protein